MTDEVKKSSDVAAVAIADNGWSSYKYKYCKTIANKHGAMVWLHTRHFNILESRINIVNKIISILLTVIGASGLPNLFAGGFWARIIKGIPVVVAIIGIISLIVAQLSPKSEIESHKRYADKSTEMFVKINEELSKPPAARVAADGFICDRMKLDADIRTTGPSIMSRVIKEYYAKFKDRAIDYDELFVKNEILMIEDELGEEGIDVNDKQSELVKRAIHAVFGIGGSQIKKRRTRRVRKVYRRSIPKQKQRQKPGVLSLALKPIMTKSAPFSLGDNDPDTELNRVKTHLRLSLNDIDTVQKPVEETNKLSKIEDDSEDSDKDNIDLPSRTPPTPSPRPTPSPPNESPKKTKRSKGARRGSASSKRRDISASIRLGVDPDPDTMSAIIKKHDLLLKGRNDRKIPGLTPNQLFELERYMYC